MKNLAVLFFMTIWLPVQSSATANIVIKGIVTLQIIDDSQPLSGVQIKINDGSPKATNSFGEFEITLANYQNGEDIIIHVIKKGYEVVNKHILINPNPGKLLRIVMCKAGERDLWARKYYDLAESAIYEQYEKSKKTIQQLRSDNKEREQQIQLLEDKLQQNLSFARQMAQQLAEKNLDETSPLYKRALKYYVNGNLDSAKLVFTTADLDLRDKKNAKDRLFYAQLLMLDQNFDDAEVNFRKAVMIYEDSETLSGYADFLFQKGDLNAALQLYTKSLKLASEKQDSAIIQKKLGNTLQAIGTYSNNCIVYYENAYNYWRDQTKAYVSTNTFIQFYTTGQGLREVYRLSGQQDILLSLINSQYNILDTLLVRIQSSDLDSTSLRYSRAKIMYFLGDLFDYSAQPFRAIYYYNQSIDELRLIQKSSESRTYMEEIAQIYYAINRVNYQQSRDINKTADNIDSLINIYKALGESNHSAEIISAYLDNVGLCFLYNRKRALSNATQAFIFIDNIIKSNYYTSKILYQQLDIYHSLAYLTYLEYNDLDAAKEYYLKGIAQSEEYIDKGFPNLFTISGYLCKSMGICAYVEFENQGRKDSSLMELSNIYLKKSIDKFRADTLIRDKDKLGNVLSSICHLTMFNFSIGKDSIALDLAKKAYDESEINSKKYDQLTKSSLESMQQVCAVLIRHYNNKDDYNNLEKNLELYYNLSYRLFPIRSKEFTKELIMISGQFNIMKDYNQSAALLKLATENINYYGFLVDSMHLANLYWYNSVISLDIAEYELAISYTKRALGAYNSSHEKGDSNLNMQITSNAYNVPQSEALEISAINTKPYSYILDCYLQLAAIKYQQEQFQIAQLYLDTAMALRKKQGLTLGLSDHYIAAMIYQKNGLNSLFQASLDSILSYPLYEKSEYTFQNLAFLFSCDKNLLNKNKKVNVKYLRKKMGTWENIALNKQFQKNNAFYDIADCYYKYEDFENALRCINICLQNQDSNSIHKNADHIRSLILCSKIHYALGLRNEANDLIEESIRLTSKLDTEEKNLLKVCLTLQKTYQQTLEEYQSVEQISQKNRLLYDQSVHAIQQAGYYTSINPDSAFILNNFALQNVHEILSTQRFAIYLRLGIDAYRGVLDSFRNEITTLQVKALDISEKSTLLNKKYINYISLMDSLITYCNEYQYLISYAKNSADYKQITSWLSTLYGSRSWYYILTGNYSSALSDARNGLILDEENSNNWININLLWSYIALDREDLATELIDKIIDEQYQGSDDEIYNYRTEIQNDLKFLNYYNVLTDKTQKYAGRINEN